MKALILVLLAVGAFATGNVEPVKAPKPQAVKAPEPQAVKVKGPSFFSTVLGPGVEWSKKSPVESTLKIKAKGEAVKTLPLPLKKPAPVTLPVIEFEIVPDIDDTAFVEEDLEPEFVEEDEFFLPAFALDGDFGIEPYSPYYSPFFPLPAVEAQGACPTMDYDLEITKAEQGWLFSFKPVSPEVQAISAVALTFNVNDPPAQTDEALLSETVPLALSADGNSFEAFLNVKEDDRLFFRFVIVPAGSKVACATSTILHTVGAEDLDLAPEAQAISEEEFFVPLAARRRGRGFGRFGGGPRGGLARGARRLGRRLGRYLGGPAPYYGGYGGWGPYYGGYAVPPYAYPYPAPPVVPAPYLASPWASPYIGW